MLKCHVLGGTIEAEVVVVLCQLVVLYRANTKICFKFRKIFTETKLKSTVS
jgi:hypothetical protein